MARVTLKDIARETGLSVTSVSLVLNGKPCRISDESRERILDAARRLHYTPNQIARSLVTQRSRTLGLVVPDLESPYFGSVAKRLEERARARDHTLLICNSEDEPAQDRELVSMLANRGVDGVFCVVSRDLGDAAEEFREVVDGLSVPVVLLDRDVPGLDVDQVTFDNELGGYLATKALIDAGHHDIAIIVNTRISMVGRSRLGGYLRALQEAGIPYDASLTFEETSSIDGGYRGGARVMESGATAVFACSDVLAIGLMKRLGQDGVDVPGRLSVVVYDGSIGDPYVDPGLTSIEQDVSKLTTVGLDLMFDRIEDPGRACSQVVLEPAVHQGGSIRRID